MHITIETVRKLLTPGLDLAGAAASFTPTTADDKAVAVLKKALADDETMDYFALLLDKLAHKLFPDSPDAHQAQAMNLLALVKEAHSEIANTA